MCCVYGDVCVCVWGGVMCICGVCVVRGGGVHVHERAVDAVSVDTHPGHRAEERTGPGLLLFLRT